MAKPKAIAKAKLPTIEQDAPPPAELPAKRAKVRVVRVPRIQAITPVIIEPAKPDPRPEPTAQQTKKTQKTGPDPKEAEPDSTEKFHNPDSISLNKCHFSDGQWRTEV